MNNNDNMILKNIQNQNQLENDYMYHAMKIMQLNQGLRSNIENMNQFKQNSKAVYYTLGNKMSLHEQRINKMPHAQRNIIDFEFAIPDKPV